MSVPKSSNIDKLQSVVMETIGASAISSWSDTRKACDLALGMAWSRDTACPDAIIFSLAMPVALFLLQVEAIKENRTSVVHDIPLSEAVCQAICMESDSEIAPLVPSLVEATFKKIAEMGYSINRNHDLSLEEAESIG